MQPHLDLVVFNRKPRLLDDLVILHLNARQRPLRGQARLVGLGLGAGVVVVDEIDLARVGGHVRLKGHAGGDRRHPDGHRAALALFIHRARVFFGHVRLNVIRLAGHLRHRVRFRIDRHHAHRVFQVLRLVGIKGEHQFHRLILTVNACRLGAATTAL